MAAVSSCLAARTTAVMADAVPPLLHSSIVDGYAQTVQGWPRSVATALIGIIGSLPTRISAHVRRLTSSIEEGWTRIVASSCLRPNLAPWPFMERTLAFRLRARSCSHIRREDP